MADTQNPATTETAEGAVAVEAAPEVAVVGSETKGGKSKNKTSGNLIFDIAQTVEGYSKAKALHRAVALVNEVETSYFELGGVLKVVSDNSWFEGFDSFPAYVFETFGFQERKARYLIQIYTDLVTKQIPGEKVLPLGWTKVKLLSPILTAENVDEWVEKAEKLSVSELSALLKKPEGEGATTAKTTEEIVKVPLKFHPDQFSIYNQGLAKAKGELQTEYDAVAVAAVFGGYLGGTTGLGTADAAAPAASFDTIAQKMGFADAINRLGELFPEYHVEVTMEADYAASIAAAATPTA